MGSEFFTTSGRIFLYIYIEEMDLGLGSRILETRSDRSISEHPKICKTYDTFLRALHPSPVYGQKSSAS